MRAVLMWLDIWQLICVLTPRRAPWSFLTYGVDFPKRRPHFLAAMTCEIAQALPVGPQHFSKRGGRLNV